MKLHSQLIRRYGRKFEKEERLEFENEASGIILSSGKKMIVGWLRNTLVFHNKTGPQNNATDNTVSVC